jgi:hypothetical protein
MPIATLQGGGVVHPVAGHGHHLALCLHGFDQTQLVFRAGARVYIHVQHGLLQLGVGHSLDLFAGEAAAVAAQAELGADGQRRGGVVAGDHLDPDAGAHAALDGGPGFLAWRIDHAEQAEQGEAACHVLEGKLALAGIDRHVGYRQYPLPVCRQFPDARFPQGMVKRMIAAVMALRHAHFQHAFRRTFQVNKGVSGVIVMQRGHETMLRLKRNDIQTRQLLALQ